jgi:hypothetical protein
MPTLLPTGTNSGCELYCDANDLSLTDGASVTTFTDQSGHGRDLAVSTSKPTFKTGVINGKSVISWNGSQNPLTNATVLSNLKCGWIVAKYNGATFATEYRGLLSGLATFDLLTGAVGETEFFDFGLDKLEFRSNDRIYPQASAPGPMNAFKIIFFRWWKGGALDGISLCQQRTFTARLWNGDVAFLYLSSRDFTEEELRANHKILAANFALSLADVYEYQADVNGHEETPEQAINFYDPPEGDRISEAITDSKRVIDLKFSVANETEVKYMKAFHAAHYPTATPFIYRDYRVTPPEDIEGYFDSQYELAGANNEFQYGFSFRER